MMDGCDKPNDIFIKSFKNSKIHNIFHIARENPLLTQSLGVLDCFAV